LIELGELERRYADFERKNTRIVAASTERQASAQKTQAECPHLAIIADTDHRLINALGMVHPHGFPSGADATAATTVLVDREGKVRWLYRPDLGMTRLSVDEVLEKIAENGEPRAESRK
jgi:alkyl hydroperoxide reductase subunit AhpC